jgi:transposase
MRGAPDPQLAMLMSLSPEELIPVGHPIRRIRRVVDEVLVELDGEFDVMYSSKGRRSVPPEALLKATVLMALYSIRSERAFCEMLNYNLLFKWFLDLAIDAKAFDATTFTKNRKRLLDHAIADRFFEEVVRQAQLRRYVSSEHFSVDGTLLEAWASHKSFKPNPPSTGDGTDSTDSQGGGGSDDDEVRPAGRNSEVDWRGQKRSNTTHTSTTDPDARLARKSMNTAARLCYSGHLLMENRNALIVDAELTGATGYAERDTAAEMLGRLPKRKRRRTVGADKGYDTAGFVAEVRDLGFTPHVAPHNNKRRSAIDGRTTRHPGHRVSQRIRPRIEEPFGWIKTIAGGHKLRYIGRDRNRAWFKMTAAIYNVLRITALDTATA